MILLTAYTVGYQIGYMLNMILTPLIFILIIGGSYYLIKRFTQNSISFGQAVLNRWVIGSSIILTLGLLRRAVNR
ncbi:hypothetical protein H6F67_22085 [Microcoleus sp. FACHB-1515]|uniref:hypothetical protein n=1 Tax=Cyanophyceae TaxID=3028117 RepID=UPI00168864A5|nr:hypothetical protein [Microcoleus sp. FACHB-1515]MBD2092542.1 hypothetical protein [Microcoleus sp. FACHB-1515]